METVDKSLLNTIYSAVDTFSVLGSMMCQNVQVIFTLLRIYAGKISRPVGPGCSAPGLMHDGPFLSEAIYQSSCGLPGIPTFGGLNARRSVICCQNKSPSTAHNIDNHNNQYIR